MRLSPIRIAVAWLAGAASLAGADLSVTVIDASGLPIPSAAIRIAATHTVLSGDTDNRGTFDFASLPAGPWKIHIEHAGFEPFDKDVTGEEKALRVQLEIETRRDSIVAKADDPAAASPIGYVSLGAEQLKRISNDPKVWVTYAQLLAGAANLPAELYVDGMPAAQLPPAVLIARIVVNPDTFSAEYADGGNAHIDVITKAPDRQFHFNLGSDALGAGGGSVLAPGPQAASHSLNGSMSGAIPRLPLAFSLTGSLSESAIPVAVTAVLPGPGFPGLDSARTGDSATRAESLSSDLYYYPSETLRLHLSRSESRSSGRNLGVGGLTLMDAGLDNSFKSGETRLAFNGGGDRLSYRGGLTVDRSNVESRARNTEPGLNVLGDFSTGGPQIEDSNAAHLAWIWKSVIEPGASPAWSAGITVAETSDSRADVPNPGGVFTFPDLASYAQFLNGASTATWTGLQGNGSFRVRHMNIAPFYQRQIWRSAHALISAGVRTDAQSSVGAFVSPRLSAAVEGHGLVVRAGAGMFAHAVPQYVFIHAVQDDGNHLTSVLISGASTDALLQSGNGAGPLVRTAFSSSLSLPRQFVGKVSANRTFGRFTPGLEYTQTRDWRLLGSQRFAAADGWLDVIASNRTRMARVLQSQLSFGWRGQRLTVYHEFVRSFDNTDGPFSFPQVQNDLATEWARSAGRAPENVTFAGSFNFKSVFLTLTDSWHGAAPYNITIAADPEGDGLFNDRAGLPRNSGNGPSYNSLSGYLSRRFAAPRAFGRAVHGITFGLRGDNLLGNKNYLSVGAIAGSPSFGQPLAAAPGRSVRLWFSLD
jgi:Carboxypeptidase regulatory-like domain